MKKSLLIWGLAVLLVGAALYTHKSQNQGVSDNTLVTQTAQASDNANKPIDFVLTDLNGKKVSLKDFKGKKIFLNFWATWCPPCRGEMPDIEKLYLNKANKDLIILAVNIGEDKETVSKFASQNGYTFRILLDQDQSVAGQYNISAVPTSYFINKAGNIVAKKIGAMTLEQMKQYVKALDKKN